MMKSAVLTDSTALPSKECQTSPTVCMSEKKETGKIYFAVISGLFATIGSLFGKLAGSFEMDSVVGLLLKGILLILMVTSNTIGCVFFVKALNSSETSLPCTITSAAVSYVCSALAGFLIFNEATSLCWWCGIFLVILGLLFIYQAPTKHDRVPFAKKPKEE